MKKIPVFCLVVFSLVVFFVFAAVGAGVAHSHPSLYGQEGLIRLPGTDVLGQGDFSLGFNYIEGKNSLHANFGVMDSMDLSLTYRLDRRGQFEPGIKYRLVEEDLRHPAIALGIQDTSLYAVGSKQLGQPSLRGYFGLGNEKFRGPMLGLSYVLNPVRLSGDGLASPLITLMGELVGEKYSVGARFDFENELGVTVAAVDMKKLAVGVSFTSRF